MFLVSTLVSHQLGRCESSHSGLSVLSSALLSIITIQYKTGWIYTCKMAGRFCYRDRLQLSLLLHAFLCLGRCDVYVCLLNSLQGECQRQWWWDLGWKLVWELQWRDPTSGVDRQWGHLGAFLETKETCSVCPVLGLWGSPHIRWVGGTRGLK